MEEMGERAEARRLFEEALAGLATQLGLAHADTLHTKGSLAALLEKMGERTEARRMHEEVLAGQMAQLGPAHADTLVTKGNLAILLVEMGERAEAPVQSAAGQRRERGKAARTE